MVRGDFAALSAFARDVAGLKGAAAEVARRAAPRLQALVASSLGSHVDPYGEGWAPFKSGGTSSSAAKDVSIAAAGNSIHCEVNPPLSYHHEGTSRMPARPVVPDEGRGIPTAWLEVLEAEAKAVVARAGAHPSGGG